MSVLVATRVELDKALTTAHNLALRNDANT
jgi:hypothetical protein